VARRDDIMAEGMHQTVICADRGDTDPRNITFRGVLPRLAASTRDDAAAALNLCKKWQISLLPRSDLAPVRSPVPVLLMSGDFDPITPPHYAAQLLAHLPNAQHVIFPTGSRGQAVVNACGNAIISAFLNAPSKRVDKTCVPTSVHAFATGDDIIFLPRLRSALQANGISGILNLLLVELPALAGMLVLLTALIAYPAAAVLRLLMHRRPAWRDMPNRWSGHAAPWIAIAAGLIVAFYLGGLATAIMSTMNGDPNLFAMGAIAANWQWLTVVPYLFFFIVLAMFLVAFLLWKRRQRSLPGR
jgi:hypothetical protein